MEFYFGAWKIPPKIYLQKWMLMFNQEILETD